MVIDKFTLVMGDGFTEGMHMPKHQIAYKKRSKMILHLRNLLMQPSVQDLVQGVET